VVHRQAFTKEQEDQILAVLSDTDPMHKVKNKAEIRVIYTIGIFTGQRLKDCALLQWQNIDMRNQRIWVKQFKTGKEVRIPIGPKLYEALLEAEHWRCDQYVTPKCAARYNRTDANGGLAGTHTGGGQKDGEDEAGENERLPGHVFFSYEGCFCAGLAHQVPSWYLAANVEEI
jgi:integrase